jgi:SAM-dependent methyltransferase
MTMYCPAAPERGWFSFHLFTPVARRSIANRTKEKVMIKNQPNELQPQIWHHGLVARYWAEFETEAGKEASFYRRLIETSGQPAVDLGCGSGRLLIPFLKSGLDIDGSDFSADMLAVCKERAEKEGLSPQLFCQPMHDLDLPRRYRTIFARGVIGLGGEHRLTLQAMRRCYEHLRPGGKFAFDYMVRWNDPPAWLSRLPEYRYSVQEWPSDGDRERMSDGSEIELVARTIAVDPLENTATRQVRARLWRAGELVQEEIHTQRLDDYTKNELLLMLETAGFEVIQIYGDFSDEPANADHEDLVFIAIK